MQKGHPSGTRVTSMHVEKTAVLRSQTIKTVLFYLSGQPKDAYSVVFRLGE